jgi:hypothetical protein
VPLIVDYFNNDIAEMKINAFGFAVEALANCKDGMETTELEEVIRAVRYDRSFVVEGVLNELENELRRRKKNENLAPYADEL